MRDVCEDSLTKRNKEEKLKYSPTKQSCLSFKMLWTSFIYQRIRICSSLHVLSNVCWHCSGILEQEYKYEYFLVMIIILSVLIKTTHNMSSLGPLIVNIVCMWEGVSDCGRRPAGTGCLTVKGMKL